MKLIDYKGKYSIIVDDDRIDDMDYVIGEISKEDAIKEVKERLEASDYYGIPAYIGSDKDLLKIYR